MDDDAGDGTSAFFGANADDEDEHEDNNDEGLLLLLRRVTGASLVLSSSSLLALTVFRCAAAVAAAFVGTMNTTCEKQAQSAEVLGGVYTGKQLERSGTLFSKSPMKRTVEHDSWLHWQKG